MFYSTVIVYTIICICNYIVYIMLRGTFHIHTYIAYVCMYRRFLVSDNILYHIMMIYSMYAYMYIHYVLAYIHTFMSIAHCPTTQAPAIHALYTNKSL